MTTGKRLRHQQAAKRDLREIWQYTERAWHRGQADRYLTEIDRTLQRLAAGLAKGVRYDARTMKMRHKAHVIFYRETEREIVIVRVLHGHMDFERHLPA